MNKHLPLIANILLLILLTVHAYRLLVMGTERAIKADFSVYCEAASRLGKGENIYQHVYQEDIYRRIFGPSVRPEKRFYMHYFYTPFIAWAFQPLAQLPYAEAKQIWTQINFVLYLFCAVVLTSLLGRWRPGGYSDLTRLNVVLAAFIVFDPFFFTFYEGQIDLVVLALLLCYFLWSREKKEGRAGVALALAVVAKMSPLLLLVEVVWHRRLKSLTSFVATLVVLALWMLSSSIPLETYSDFFLKFGALASGSLETSLFFNVAFAKTLLYPFGLENAALVRAIISIVVLVISLVLLGRMPGDERSRERQRAYLVILMFLLSPTVWFHHFVWALIPWLVCVELVGDFKAPSYPRWCVLIAIYLALAKAWTFHALAFSYNPNLAQWTALIPNTALISMAYVLVTRSWLKLARERR